MDALAKTVPGKLAVALSLSPVTFNALLATAVPKKGKYATSSLEAIRYKARCQTGSPIHFKESTIYEIHVDRDLLTVIYPDIKCGLQVIPAHIVTLCVCAVCMLNPC